MALDKINHYSLTDAATVYDEDAMTALQLIACCVAKLNQAIDAYNKLESDTDSKLTAQDNFIEKMNSITMPAEVKAEVNRHIQNGDFDRAINTYIGDLESRLDNLINSIPEGGTTMDAEVIDGRIDFENVTHSTIGNAIRVITKSLSDKIKYLNECVNALDFVDVTNYYEKVVGCYSAVTSEYFKTSNFECVVMPYKTLDTFMLTSSNQGGGVACMFYSDTPTASTFIGKVAFNNEYGTEIVDNVDKIIEVPEYISTRAKYVAFNHLNTSGKPFQIKVKSIDSSFMTIPTHKKIYATLAANELKVFTKYDANQDLCVRLRPYGGNGLFDFSNFTLYANSKPYPVKGSNGTSIINSYTDWFAPYNVLAINNIDGDSTLLEHFTGGNHEYTNSGSGGSPTATMTDIKFIIDGVPVDNFDGECENIKIYWKNKVQAANTKKEDGTGRYVLEEIHTLTFDGEKWCCDISFMPYEDLTINRWYGVQIAGLSTKDTIRYVGGSNRTVNSLNVSSVCGNATCNKMICEKENLIISLEIDKTIDLGDSSMFSGSDRAFAFNYGKAYFYMIKNKPVTANSHYYMRATYKFNKPMEV